MGIDFLTTHYALSNNLGYEGNGFMSGIVSNPILFILTKLIGSMVIIFMMKKILEKNKVWAFRGMRLIIFMMLFVILNNSLVISANALTFNNLSTGGTGSINNGNGFFDNPESTFSYTGSRNVYLLSEDTQINIIEPISFSSGSSNAYTLINSSFGTIKDAVVHQGYIYFIDGTTLKKRGGHSDTSQCESNDTTAGGCITTIATAVDSPVLRIYNNNIYFIKSGTLYTLDEFDSTQSVFTLPAGTAPGGGAVYTSFAVTTNGSNLVVYLMNTVGTNNLRYCTSTSCTLAYNVGIANLPQHTTLFTTTNFIYFVYQCPGCGAGTDGEALIRFTNGSVDTTVNYISDESLQQDNRIMVGGQSTVGLLASSSTTYETFNSAEVGLDSLPVIPAELTYDTKDISSLDSTYYNKSTIYLSYNIVLNSLNANNLLLDFNNYRWMISLTDPNGVTTDIIQSPECSYSSIIDTTCQVDSTMGINAPSNGWLQGTWYAKLYEINIVDPNRALITTSTGFTVLNTTAENQSVIPPPFTPPTSGTAPQAISIIDGFVSWLGLGVNSVSKLLFAMIIIAIAATVGLVYGNGNIAMVFAFVPYAFFTFIDYIPKWIFIIAILLIAVVSRMFR